jgi:hypothetical protein
MKRNNKETFLRLLLDKWVSKIMSIFLRNALDLTHNHQIYLKIVSSFLESKININQTSNLIESRGRIQHAEQ